MQTAFNVSEVATIMLSPIESRYLCLNSAETWAIWLSTGITLNSCIR